MLPARTFNNAESHAMSEKKRLHTRDHSRDSGGLRYVYPVVSRRAGGVSIGINLNPNDACNWRCVYCQVPELKRGSAPDIDRKVLEDELKCFLEDVLKSDFFERYGVDPEYRHLRDIAISGNGEPTSARGFAEIIDLIGSVMADYDLVPRLNLVLISNGSLIHQESVRQGLMRLARLGGEIWFKLDCVTDEGLIRINNAAISVARIRENLRISSVLCRTWVQTCVFGFKGEIMSAHERQAYLDFLRGAKQPGNLLKGVLLYTLARPSQQPESSQLTAADPEWMQEFSHEIEALGLEVKVSS